MKVKPSSMVKFGWVFLVLNLVAAVFFTTTHDRFRTFASLAGAVLWVVCIWVWSNKGERQ